MRIFNLILTIITLSIVHPGVSLSQAKISKASFVKGIKIVQLSEISGEVLVLATPKAARIVNRKAGYKIIMKAPNWNVWVFNDTRKVVYKTTWNKFKLDFDYGSNIIRKARYSESSEKILFGHETMHGFRTTHQKVKTKGKKSGGVLNVAQVDYWIIDKSLIPQPVTKVIQELYRLPKLDGYPLKITYVTAQGKVCEDVVSKVVTRRSFKKKRFKVPANYKQVSQLSKVMLNMDDANNMIEMLLGK